MEQIEFPTPNSLLEAFKKLHGTQMSSLKELIDTVHIISDSENCRYIAGSTGPSRFTQIFRCCHFNSDCKCKATLRLNYDFDDHFVRFAGCDIYHNHPIGIEFTKRTRNTLSTEQKQKIIDATRRGVTASQIRSDLNLSCSKDVLYSVRRNILKEMKMSEMEQTHENQQET